MLAFARPTIPESSVGRVTWSFSEFYTPLNFSEMTDDRIVKFCARIGLRTACLVMTNCPLDGRGQGHVTTSFFWQISVNIWKTVQDRDILTTGRLVGNSIWPIKWQQRQWPWMILKVIHRLQAFLNAIRRTFVQHFTRFQLTVCSHGSSALAELLVNFV